MKSMNTPLVRLRTERTEVLRHQRQGTAALHAPRAARRGHQGRPQHRDRGEAAGARGRGPPNAAVSAGVRPAPATASLRGGRDGGTSSFNEAVYQRHLKTSIPEGSKQF